MLKKFMLSAALFTACLVTIQSVNATPKEEIQGLSKENEVETNGLRTSIKPPPSENDSNTPKKRWLKIDRLMNGKKESPYWVEKANTDPNRFKIKNNTLYISL